MIISLEKIPLFEISREMKDGIINQILKVESLDELIIWNRYSRCKKKQKARLKKYFERRIWNSLSEIVNQLE
jgi:polyphosphate kinase